MTDGVNSPNLAVRNIGQIRALADEAIEKANQMTSLLQELTRLLDRPAEDNPEQGGGGG